MLNNFVLPNGDKITVEQALNGEADKFAPRPLFKYLSRERTWTGRPSTTQLLNGNRYNVLRLVANWDMEIEGSLFAFLGTGVHKVLEEAGDLTEMHIEYKGITGTADLLSNDTLIDYKVFGSYAVARKLGVVKTGMKEIIGDDGLPVLRKRNSKYGCVGEPMTEPVYSLDPDKADLKNETLQLNLYRLGILEAGIEVKRLKLFVLVRDSNTTSARSRGVVQQYYYVDIPILDKGEVENYFFPKRDELNNVMKVAKRYIGKSNDKIVEGLRRIIPEACNPEEAWNGRRCEGYCPVANICKKFGNPYVADSELNNF